MNDIYRHLSDAILQEQERVSDLTHPLTYQYKVESGQYIGDSSERSKVNSTVLELLDTFIPDIIKFFDLDLKNLSSDLSLTKCRKSLSEKDRWHVISIIITPAKKAKRGNLFRRAKSNQTSLSACDTEITGILIDGISIYYQIVVVSRMANFICLR